MVRVARPVDQLAIMSPDDDAPDRQPGPAAGGSLLLDRLFRSERALLTRFIARKIGDPDEASDLTQEAFARLAGVLPGGLSGRPEAYLHRIVRNLLFDRSRRRRARRAHQHVPIDEEELPPVAAEQSWTIEAADLLKRYQAAIADLTAPTKEIFLLHRIEELSYAEIAMRLGVTPRTVEYHVAKALLHLRRTLDSE